MDAKDGKTLLWFSASRQKYKMCSWSGLWVCVCEICNHRLVLGENFMTLHFEVGASNEKPCLWWSVNFGCGNLTCTEEVWGWGNYLLSTGFMCSLDSNSGGGGDWGGGGTVGIACIFLAEL